MGMLLRHLIGLAWTPIVIQDELNTLMTRCEIDFDFDLDLDLDLDPKIEFKFEFEDHLVID
ncbi:MAG: hypothetical protein J07HQW1_00563 [Haloquadratum walsbyi J07HQW1]|uniref:Uncharacterized protein n=1 Tax=Haloquadratum walsbyi J07HQW1 TaxID=1238424 RepID=U1N222_9EURY|nr:MAG: hypothetical protein J07HQW1_00563 [Haloquadratum walsbyi J07HQW1]